MGLTMWLYVLIAMVGVIGVAFLTAQWGVAWLTPSNTDAEKRRRARYYEGFR